MDKAKEPVESCKTDLLQRSLDGLRYELESFKAILDRFEKGLSKVTVAVFGRFDEDTVSHHPGLYDQMQMMKWPLFIVAGSLLVLALHTIGMPTELLWKVIATFFTHT